MSPTPFLEAVLNLSRFHREHEKFYATSPREVAVVLQRHGRTLQALADRWSTTETSVTHAPFSPYEGCEELNSEVALQLDGVLFMEGEGRPAELSHLIRDLRSAARDFQATGEWLATAMQASWDIAAGLTDIEGLADLLGERHRIIANDWQAAHMSFADRAPARPRCGHPREHRLHAGSTSRRPWGAAGLARPLVLGRGADRTCRGPVQ